jgi:threonine dehydrogenase-like Zn-dependent dehydrogenase
VIAIDRVPERLMMAANRGKAEVIDLRSTRVFEALKDMTGGRGPDSCIDAVGMEAHGPSLDAYIDKIKAAAFLATDRPSALRQAIHTCRKGGIVSIPGVYGGLLDKIPFGAAFQKGLTFRMGQTHMMKYMQPLLDRIERGEIDPTRVITHRLPLAEAPHGYDIFKHKQDHCEKVVLKP